MRNYASYNDVDLINLLKDNNEAIFDELYFRYWQSLFTKANNFLQNEDAAKDCVQNVFISLWQNRYTLQIENVNHYLHQAVRFQAFKIIKEKKFLINIDERLDNFTQVILQNHNLEYQELKNIINNIISKLPDDQQEIFILNREYGLTYKQIADKKNISIKTVEKKMSQALKQLRAGARMPSNYMLLYLAIFGIA